MSEQDQLPGFEGAEKCLEVWFKPYDVTGNCDQKLGLLKVERTDWEDMLRLVKCTIIGYSSNGALDSYLLSESSMFVSPFRIVLKTCGTTTLLMCLEKLVQVAASAGLKIVDQFFYSRKCFLFPEYQKFPHTFWDEEVRHIETLFPGGSAYVVGKTNSNHWYCYLWGEGRANRVHECLESKDYTIEILMTGLHPENEPLYTKAGGVNTEKNSHHITDSLYTLYNDITIDDFMFDPCGYSCNGYGNKGSNYFTVHVTPEDHCSYASFESNIPPTESQSHAALVLKVINIFKPSKFTITLFAEKDDYFEEVLHNKPYQDCGIGPSLGKYQRKDRILYEFEHYDLAFYHYEILNDNAKS